MSGPSRARGAWPWIVIVGLVLVLAAIGGRAGQGGPPLDPTSTSPDGAKALALLLGVLGARVDRTTGPPAPGSDGTALVLQDRLDLDGHRRLVDWVRAGGTLVAADPALSADFAAPAREPGAGGIVTASGSLTAGCASPAVAGVATIDPAGGVALRPPAGAAGCFPVRGGGDFLIVLPVGRGTVVLVGGPDVWTNAHLAKLDNSVLAANLLAPGGRPSTVSWIIGPRPGSGHLSLWQLVPARVKEGLAQLLVAVGLLCAWRGRRLGRPVTEAQPVELAGSELVTAVGHLLHQGRRLDDAAGIVRAGLARSLVDQLGVGTASSPEVLADVVAARTGIDRRQVLATLAGPTPADEAALVGLARSADSIRQEMADAR